MTLPEPYFVINSQSTRRVKVELLVRKHVLLCSKQALSCWIGSISRTVRKWQTWKIWVNLISKTRHRRFTEGLPFSRAITIKIWPRINKQKKKPREGHEQTAANTLQLFHRGFSAAEAIEFAPTFVHQGTVFVSAAPPLPLFNCVWRMKVAHQVPPNFIWGKKQTFFFFTMLFLSFWPYPHTPNSDLKLQKTGFPERKI